MLIGRIELLGRDDGFSCSTSELMSMAERVLRGQHTPLASCTFELPVNIEFWRDRSSERCAEGGVWYRLPGGSRQPAVTLYLDSEVRCCNKVNG